MNSVQPPGALEDIEARAHLAFVSDYKTRAPDPSVLKVEHPVAAQIRARMRSWTSTNRNGLRSLTGHCGLIRATPETLPKILHFISHLAWHLDANGFRTFIDSQSVTLHTEYPGCPNQHFWIEWEGGASRSRRRITVFPSAETWRDSKTWSLEERVSDIVERTIACAVATRIRREASETRAVRERDAAQRAAQHKAEEARLADNTATVLAAAGKWKDRQALHELHSAMENTASTAELESIRKVILRLEREVRDLLFAARDANAPTAVLEKP